MKLIILIATILLFINLSEGGKRKAQGKVKYELNWSSGLGGCENFDNKYIDASGMKVTKDTPISTMLTGDLVFKEPLNPETEMVVLIEKETPQGKVVAYTLEVQDICNHVNESGMPWTVFFNAMNLKKKACPIPARTFKMNDLKMVMGSMEKALNQETVGEYVAKLILNSKGQTELGAIQKDEICCYVIGFTVDEIREKS